MISLHNHHSLRPHKSKLGWTERCHGYRTLRFQMTCRRQSRRRRTPSIGDHQPPLSTADTRHKTGFNFLRMRGGGTYRVPLDCRRLQSPCNNVSSVSATSKNDAVAGTGGSVARVGGSYVDNISTVALPILRYYGVIKSRALQRRSADRVVIATILFANVNYRYVSSNGPMIL